MKRCPYCGAELAGRLIDSVMDDKQVDVWCPQKPRKAPPVAPANSEADR